MLADTSVTQTKLDIQRSNRDQRILVAAGLYEQCNNGAYLIHKTTRAGCTTSMVAEAINRGEQFCCIVPTNSIADRTIVEEAKRYSDAATKRIIHLPSNHECIINKKMCDEHPELKALPILPLADKCDECSYYSKCPVTEILRYPDSSGFVLTSSKLVALMLATSTGRTNQAQEIIDIIEASDVILLDEIHELQYGRATELTVYDNGKAKKSLDLNKYLPILESFPKLGKVLQVLQRILDSSEICVDKKQIFDAINQDNHWEHHLRLSHPNKWKDNEVEKSKFMIGCYKEIIELTLKREQYNLTISDILELYRMLNVVKSDQVTVNGVKEQGNAKVRLVAQDWLFTGMIASFMMSVQTKDKKIWLTSATICSYDYNKLFTKKVTTVLFGEHGDPMNTNDKMLILSDSKRYHNFGRNGIFRRNEEIINKIQAILKHYPDALIITTSRKNAHRLEKDLEDAGCSHHVTYYKSVETMGVACESRVMIAIGAAYKPANGFDAVTNSREESDILKEEAMHSDSWQAWSRVKDPEGQTPSLVFALGCNERDCENIVTWGIGRKVIVSRSEKNKRKNACVHCETNHMTKPRVIKCKSIGEMLQYAAKWTHIQINDKELVQKNLINNIVRQFSTSSFTINSDCDILDLLIGRRDTYAKQVKKGNSRATFTRIPCHIDNQLLKEHSDGLVTIGAYCIDTNNNVKWICFDIDAHPKEDDTTATIMEEQAKADADVKRLCAFLNDNDISYILESSGTPNSYHVWILLKPVKAGIAKKFGEAIKRELELDCELFPKQKSLGRKGYGNLVKLPFAINLKNNARSKIWINGEWVEHIPEEGIEIGILDISSFETQAEKLRIKQKQEKRKRKNNAPIPKTVRPCISKALDMDLRGPQGHYMRIAIAREFHNIAGYPDRDIAKLFEKQSDYDYNTSLSHVRSVTCKDMPVFRCDTLRDKCPDLVDCLGCRYSQ